MNKDKVYRLYVHYSQEYRIGIYMCMHCSEDTIVITAGLHMQKSIFMIRGVMQISVDGAVHIWLTNKSLAPKHIHTNLCAENTYTNLDMHYLSEYTYKYKYAQRFSFVTLVSLINLHAHINSMFVGNPAYLSKIKRLHCEHSKHWMALFRL